MKKDGNIDERYIYNGFKLISLELQENRLFGDIKYNFIDPSDKQDEIYTTVLIGENGTLKSRLFQKVIELFWSLHNLKNAAKEHVADKFHLKYSLNGMIYEFYNLNTEVEGDQKSGQVQLRIDNVIKQDFSETELPMSIIASAIMVTDRFPFPDPEKFKIYQYLGSRYRPQLASTKTYIGRVVGFVSNNFDSLAFINGVRAIVNEFFHNSTPPCITFYTQNTPRFFKGGMKLEEMCNFYEEMDIKYKEKGTAPPFKLNHYKSKIKTDPHLGKKIVDYCNSLKNDGNLRSFPRSSMKAISFNLMKEGDVIKLSEQFHLLDHMRQLGMVYPAEMEFLRPVQINGKTVLEGYAIDQSSSGEYNLLGSMIGLMASIKPNSLIFIDEPEISLHPNWQMKFLSFLRKLFSDKNYGTCHVIVATHSHFLISDLKPESSKIIGLKREHNRIEIVDFPVNMDTFCWMPEDILYNVFGVESSRNSFVAETIANILDELSKGKKDDVNKLDKETYSTLTNLDKNLKDSDPLKEVVRSILKKVEA